MKARIIDLRYKMKDVLEALDRKETVTIVSRGKVKGKIIPINSGKRRSVSDHPFFGMYRAKTTTVSKEISELKKERYNYI